MQLLEVSGAVLPIYGSLGVKRLRVKAFMSLQIIWHQNIFINVLSMFLQYVNCRRTICISPYFL